MRVRERLLRQYLADTGRSSHFSWPAATSLRTKPSLLAGVDALRGHGAIFQAHLAKHPQEALILPKGVE